MHVGMFFIHNPCRLARIPIGGMQRKRGVVHCAAFCKGDQPEKLTSMRKRMRAYAGTTNRQGNARDGWSVVGIA